MLSKIASTGKFKNKNIEKSEWDNLFKGLYNDDNFLHTKLEKLIGEENKNLLESISLNIDDINPLNFNDFVGIVQVLIENNLDQYNKLYDSAQKINIIAYPLTREYFLYRYISKAILVVNNPDLKESYIKEFEDEKKAHLELTHYVNSLEQNYRKIEKANSIFNEEHKVNSWLIEKSNVVSNHSGKIAIVYSVLIAGVIALRSYAYDEEDPLYELCALPTTTLAMLQLLLSFPGTVLSSKQTKIINDNMFKELESKLNDKNCLEDIKFLSDNTPSFSNNIIDTVAICFRYSANLLLQPIDLLNNDNVNNFIVCTALRWLSAAGVIEEQSKVTNFIHNKLIEFLHDKISPALIENKILLSEQIKPYFYLLSKHLKNNEPNDEQKLQAIYKKLTGQDIDFNDSELSNIHTYNYWQDIAKYSAVATLILDYICFYFRDSEVTFYEDPMFYASISIKFMRLASLLVSSYCGDKITKDIIGEKLSENIFFQDFYYNDGARLTMAIIPLIMFESIKDLKFLSLATLIDVLTTAISDLNVARAIDNAGKIIAEKTVNTLSLLSKHLDINLDERAEIVINVINENDENTGFVSLLGA